MVDQSYLGFLLGGVPLAIEASRARAVEPSCDLIPVPFARRSVAGVLIREGRLICVADLARVLALWNEVVTEGGEQIVVLSAGEVEGGFLAGGVEAFRCEPGQASPDGSQALASAPIREAILCGAVRSRARTYGLFRAEAALAAAGIPVAEN